jgi:hypothetical protein
MANELDACQLSPRCLETTPSMIGKTIKAIDPAVDSATANWADKRNSNLPLFRALIDRLLPAATRMHIA